MSFSAARVAEDGGEVEEEARAMPAEVSWEMLDKSRFFVLGAALFSGVSAALYPAVVLKTHLQVAPPPQAAASAAAAAILRRDGPRGFYRGFGASLAGTVPARALYMAALEATKSAVSSAALRLGVAEPAASAAASAAGGVSAAVAAQVVWTPVDIVSQRLMVQTAPAATATATAHYRGGADAFRKILLADGVRGLYRGFGLSVLTYAPSSAAWWASYATAQRLLWRVVGPAHHDSLGAAMAVQGASAAAAGGAAALVTMPLDTVKTRLQVMDAGARSPTLAAAARELVREGGWAACYRGFGPRWASMSLSAATMVTAYEFLKRLSAKEGSL
ncbi:hypothetical protein BAE44_0021074 [Dichanthelium oligosanthes]|uniref:Solute carrier family 25 member 44 n=1 Tax=Dichanthelium oligosanthes TaxID=888268 RepID=A0A1E5UYH8_9POAL|nr:hypothetical protein BAE44_0021074 [Dichanthelium oligosanthes]